MKLLQTIYIANQFILFFLKFKIILFNLVNVFIQFKILFNFKLRLMFLNFMFPKYYSLKH